MASEEPGKKHPIQKLLDNTWWLLFLGIVVPFVSFTIWGWIEVISVPPATLP